MKISKMEMVDPKLISVILKSEKQKKKAKTKQKGPQLIFIHFLKVYTGLHTPTSSYTYIIAYILRQ